MLRTLGQKFLVMTPMPVTIYRIVHLELSFEHSAAIWVICHLSDGQWVPYHWVMLWCALAFYNVVSAHWWGDGLFDVVGVVELGNLKILCFY